MRMSRDDAVLAALVRGRRSALVGYAYVLVGDVAQAEDLVHEALYRTFVRPRGLADPDHAEAYVRRAIVRIYLNGRRSHQRFVARMHLFVASEHTADPATATSDRGVVHAALRALSPRERACVVLHHMDGLRVREVAEVLGLAEGTVKRYIADGLVKLHRELDGADAEGRKV